MLHILAAPEGRHGIRRTSGILLHPTSLPGRGGVGEIGPEARRFAALLDSMEQTWWQVLPVGPTGYGDSPYQSPSTFAGNPLLVSLPDLVEDGLLDADRLAALPDFPAEWVAFETVIPARATLLSDVGDSFLRRAAPDLVGGFEAFCARHGAAWLDDFALYTALKEAHAMQPWWAWERDLRLRRPAALAAARNRLAAEMHRVRVVQFLFDLHWGRLRDTCGSHGVSLFGDVPIFVAHDSADVWGNPDLFLLDGEGRPTEVTGVPPDYFSATGQRWGNPHYRWRRHAATDFAWWKQRMERAFALFDLVRIDHFRGFAASWHIPSDEPTAVHGRWVGAPGRRLFDSLQRHFGTLPVVAEDLGVITPDVVALRDRYGFLGMKVLQFGFGADEDHDPSRFGENVVAYTGTHDNNTLLGWLAEPDREEERARAMATTGSDGSALGWDLLRLVWSSPALLAMAPLQDLLGLGAEARMNTPGTASGNWRWRFRREQVTGEVVEKLRNLTVATGRA